MRIERISGKEERRILIGMIVDASVCGRIAAKWEPDLFRSKWANIVGELCVKYNKQYGEAPGKAIEGLFESWASEAKDKDTVGLVERFLGALSGEYEERRKELNPSYVVDQAAKHFTRVKLQRLAELVNGDIDMGEIDKAAERVAGFGRVELGAGAGVHVLKDETLLQKAFAEREAPLFVMPGHLGKFFGHNLCRGGFVVYEGMEKIGKTAWLVETAWTAMCQRCKVAFFSVGDESEEEMMIRFAMRAARRPMFPCTVRIPQSITREGKEVSVDLREHVFERGLSYQRAVKAFRETMETKVRSKKEFLRMSVHPNSTVTVKGLEEQLRVWERDGWVPDVVVVDYMDILAESGNGRDDVRHRINATWKDMRALSQRWHVLVVSATQANAAAFESKELLSRKNFSEDKRKLAHVTGMVGINQFDDDKLQQLFRINWIVRRGAKFNGKYCVKVAGCMEIGCPVIKTCL